MPTRRSGKAANRRTRQRPPRRPVIPQPPPRATTTPADETEVEAPIRVEASPVPAPRQVPTIYSGASRLSERAAAEYHYVGRDLRNIAVLTAIIAILLLAAWLILPATGLVSR
jgi:hypothetical protein